MLLTRGIGRILVCHEDIAVDLRLRRNALLCGIVTVDGLSHARERGHRIVRHTPDDVEDDVEVARLHVVTVGLLFLSCNVEFDTELRILCLQVLRGGLFHDRIDVVEEVETELLPVLLAHTVRAHRPARLLDELSGGIGIVLVLHHVDVRIRHILCKERLCGRLKTIENILRDCLTVRRIVERTTDIQIVQDGVRRVEHELSRRSGRGECRLIPLHIRELLDRIAVDHILAEDEVDLTLFKRKQARLVVGNDLDCDLADRWLLAPVVFVALKDRILVRDVLDKLIRTRADVLRHAVLRQAVLHDLR